MTDQIALENSKPIVMERCKNIVHAVLTKFMMIQSPEEEYAKELVPYKEQAAEWMKTVDEIPSGNCGYGPAAGRSEAVPEGAGL